MGQAYPRLVLLALVALLSAGLFPQALGNGKGKGKVHGGGAVNPLVAGICSRAPFPEVCTSTAGRHASKYPVIDNLAVLNMQVAAFAKRTAQARKHVAVAARTIPPPQAQALRTCDTMYMNTQDAIGAAQRAIAFKDTGTAKIMLQLAVQDFDSCDRPFTHAGVPNPMGKFDKELSQMANNCMTLANMI
jgi:pectinesterase inhibitor-like protein